MKELSLTMDLNPCQNPLDSTSILLLTVICNMLFTASLSCLRAGEMNLLHEMHGLTSILQ